MKPVCHLWPKSNSFSDAFQQDFILAPLTEQKSAVIVIVPF